MVNDLLEVSNRFSFERLYSYAAICCLLARGELLSTLLLTHIMMTASVFHVTLFIESYKMKSDFVDL